MPRAEPQPGGLRPRRDRGTARKRVPQPAKPRPPIEVCLLAGGRSRRMGRDKSRLRWVGRTFISHLRQAARSAGLPCRTIRRDLGPSRGPLSGIRTALITARADAALFLPCDMPLVTAALLTAFVRRFQRRRRPLFTRTSHGVGFPLLLPTASLEIVESQLAVDALALQDLARALRADRFSFPARALPRLVNINTPAELAALRLSPVAATPPRRGLSHAPIARKVRP